MSKDRYIYAVAKEHPRAGKHGWDEVKSWWEGSKDQKKLNPMTRARIERFLKERTP